MKNNFNFQITLQFEIIADLPGNFILVDNIFFKV